PAASPAAFTDTVRVAGVVPLVGVTVNQLALDAAAKVVAVVLLNCTVCDAGVVPPKVCEKVRDDGEVMMALDAPLLMVKLTGIVTVVAPPVTVLDALPVFPAASPAALTDTVSVAGVVPLVGVTVNQLALDEAEKVVAVVLLNCTVCEVAAVPPTV